MNKKISTEAIEQYSHVYATRLCNQFFANQLFIGGSEILTLCQVKQVNLFALHRLMYLWKQEAEKLHSPYFNYQAHEVTEALTQFQNILSNHIQVSRIDFELLLKSAVRKTLDLILTPYDFYADLLDRYQTEFIHLDFLKTEIKYIKINQIPLEKLVAKLEEQGFTQLTGKEALGILDSILEEVSFTPVDFDDYFIHFSDLVPVSLDSFFEHDSASFIPPDNQSTSSPSIQHHVSDTESANVFFSSSSNPLSSNKKKSLKDTLTINQKFMFTKFLFNGDFDSFSEKLDRIDEFEQLQQALVYLENVHPNWDKESEEYEEFLEVLEKKFEERIRR